MSLSRADFISHREVKWCPGCGDYAILAAMQKALPAIGRAPHEVVVVSGIGCAGRLPYYLNAYGFHTIHGRAPAVASGIKMMSPELSVWVIVGDGDGLSIGLNHLYHCLRRNIDVNILLINNQIYGLTKGQYSPTSTQGQKTKTSPEGYQEPAINPIKMALSAGSTFVARAVDKDPNMLSELMVQAHQHQGVSFIEVYQNCNVFNDGVFDHFAEKKNRNANTVYLKPNEPMIYGEKNELGLFYDEQNSELCSASINDTNQTSIAIHDESNWLQAMSLAPRKETPIPLGILYRNAQPVITSAPKVDNKLDKLRALLAG